MATLGFWVNYGVWLCATTESCDADFCIWRIITAASGLDIYDDSAAKRLRPSSLLGDLDGIDGGVIGICFIIAAGSNEHAQSAKYDAGRGKPGASHHRFAGG